MFEKMIVKKVGEQDHYEIWEKKAFSAQGEIEAELETKVKDFAKAIAFSNSENTQKENKKMYDNILKGKIAECAVDQFLTEQGIETPGVDFTTTNASSDNTAKFTIGNVKILVKSAREFGNLLLLEQPAENEVEATFTAVDYDFVVLVRIKPRRTYEITGFITQTDLVETIMKNEHVLPKGAFLNGTTQMSASHYYVQTGCLRTMTGFKNAFNKAVNDN
ncbi:MAG: hypothetical protein ACRC1D_00260 [Culicoidibacterales bacterium]